MKTLLKSTLTAFAATGLLAGAYTLSGAPAQAETVTSASPAQPAGDSATPSPGDTQPQEGWFAAMFHRHHGRHEHRHHGDDCGTGRYGDPDRHDMRQMDMQHQGRLNPPADTAPGHAPAEPIVPPAPPSN